MGKRPDGRLKWLHKADISRSFCVKDEPIEYQLQSEALVLASKGRIAAPAIYDIVLGSTGLSRHVFMMGLALSVTQYRL